MDERDAAGLFAVVPALEDHPSLECLADRSQNAAKHYATDEGDDQRGVIEEAVDSHHNTNGRQDREQNEHRWRAIPHDCFAICIDPDPYRSI